jgi:hypothetical protein
MPRRVCLVKRFVVLFKSHYIFVCGRLSGQFLALKCWSRGSPRQSRVCTMTRSVMSARPWVE